MKKIVVYGLGEVGKVVAQTLMQKQNEFKVEIKGFCDKREIVDTEFKAFTPDILNELEFDYLVCTSQKWYEDIKNELTSIYKIPDEKILLFNELFVGGEHYCNVCGREVRMFLPDGRKAPVFNEKRIIGGGYRKNCTCPFCESTDRHRWLQYVLETETDIFKKNNIKVLHFAPEHEVEKRIREKNIDYITADIVRGKADVVEDITDLSFENGLFDYIICNHVLEHIKEENKAFGELKRCIKPNGSIIISVPICWEQETFEDERITTPEDRKRYYGQDDHVRIYGKNFEQHLKEYGFEVKGIFVDNEKYYELKKLCLIPQDSIWILNKS